MWTLTLLPALQKNSFGFVWGTLAVCICVLVMVSEVSAKEALSLPFEVKPSPSKKFRSGSSFSRRGAPSGNSCITYQPSVSGEYKAQVTTKAEVEPGQSQGWGPHVNGHFLLSPHLPRTSASHSCQEKPSCYIFSTISPLPHFLFFVIY